MMRRAKFRLAVGFLHRPPVPIGDGIGGTRNGRLLTRVVFRVIAGNAVDLGGFSASARVRRRMVGSPW